MPSPLALLLFGLCPCLALASHKARASAWALQQTYAGASFFDDWNFWTADDPTLGQVHYRSWQDSWNLGLIYSQPGTEKAVMQVDHWNDLPHGAKRNSVRITSQVTYSGGLFILDVDRVPFGCAVWPAFWLFGPQWPNNGEIDIIETIHGNTQAQLTVHTAPGCYLTSPGVYSGTTLTTSCESNNDNNAGCSIRSINTASVGSLFNEYGGGVYVMQWDGDGIQIWIFNRADIPADIGALQPDPTAWRLPDAAFAASGCDPYKYFKDMQMVFDITLCGTWAGDSSAWAGSGCPGTCEDTVMTASNFVNATWIINSLRVYGTSSTTYSTSQVKNNSYPYVTPGSGSLRSAVKNIWPWAGLAGLTVALAI